MNPMQSPNTGVGKGPGNQFYMEVTYEIPPTRAVKLTCFEEMSMSTKDIKALIRAENPTWKILSLKRGLFREQKDY